jgi:phospholipase C
MNRSIRTVLAVAAASGLCFAGTAAGAAAAAGHPARAGGTATPIKHLVVIFQENVSFDHYFATYPNASNSNGNPFHPKPGTPSVNGLGFALRTHNPNEFQPKRLSPAQALTCDQDHGYTAEQSAYDGGLMDQFVQDTGNSDCTAPEGGSHTRARQPANTMKAWLRPCFLRRPRPSR